MTARRSPLTLFVGAIWLFLGLVLPVLPAWAASGAADPSDVNDPVAPWSIWRAYSRVAPSVNAGNLLVSTVIAASGDAGRGFSDVSTLNTAVDYPGGVTENHETPSLVNDDQGWGVIWDHHLAMNGAPWPTYAWLGMKRTAYVWDGWGAEQKLIAGSSYDPYNSMNPGWPLFVLPSQMADCALLSEPGALAAPGGGYYLSVDCTAGWMRRTELLKINGGTLTYLGTLLKASDAPLFAAVYGQAFRPLAQTKAFTETDLVQVGNSIYLLASPVVFDPTPHNQGCVVFIVTDIGTAQLYRTPNGSPFASRYIAGLPNQGACTYASHEVGVWASRFDPESTPELTLMQTGIAVP
jgi:hypothetical protein